MAGDWIKVEHATCDKAEVLRIADLLGWDRRRAVGLLIDFWVWLDRNISNAHGVTNVTHMSRKSIDEVMNCPGFAACLIDVGWAEIDDETGILTVINGHRHNGNPAKSRALGKDRAATHRVTQSSRKSNAKNVTREEKRRDIKKIDKRKMPIPNDFAISERVKTWALAKGYASTLPARFDHFVDSCKAKGYEYADWDSAFMTAIRSDWAKLGPAGNGPDQPLKVQL